jgi:hypothetical protein
MPSFLPMMPGFVFMIFSSALGASCPRRGP